jgi:lipopolysaccharide transport system permease protein
VQREQSIPVAAVRRPVRRIQPSRGLLRLDVAELWRFRELLYFLVWRDVKARYKQTLLGASWAILRPLVSMLVFAVILGKLAGIDSGSDVPYPLFLFSGLLLWLYFASALSSGAASLVGNASIVGKAYFPRLYIPAAAVVAPLVDLALAAVVLAGLFAWYGELPGWQIVLLPAFLALTVLIVLGAATWLAALNVRYRDVTFVLPFATQLLLFLTPVLYPVTLVPERWHWLLALNPLTGVTTGFRWSLVGGAAPPWDAVAASAAAAVLLVAASVVYFTRADRTFADLI